ncbi:hypothetical protein PG990_002048 [Apiospora arundinis]|uniref:Uncharacterized protein n=1 Tax=Apiospora arundinis TaxID=335852 RepID=A0ABR2I4E0_9PEZI
MQLSLTFVVAALATLAAAAPSTNNERGVAPGISPRRSCAWNGKCNGTKCKIGLINYKCSSGSCVGPGGGDGKHCCAVDALAGGPYACPGGNFP